MKTTPQEYMPLLIEALTCAAKCPVFTQNDEKSFFSDSENNIFVHVKLGQEDMEITIRVREEYSLNEAVMNKYNAIKETLQIA